MAEETKIDNPSEDVSLTETELADITSNMVIVDEGEVPIVNSADGEDDEIFINGDDYPEEESDTVSANFDNDYIIDEAEFEEDFARGLPNLDDNADEASLNDEDTAESDLAITRSDSPQTIARFEEELKKRQRRQADRAAREARDAEGADFEEIETGEEDISEELNLEEIETGEEDISEELNLEEIETGEEDISEELNLEEIETGEEDISEELNLEEIETEMEDVSTDLVLEEIDEDLDDRSALGSETTSDGSDELLPDDIVDMEEPDEKFTEDTYALDEDDETLVSLTSNDEVGEDVTVDENVGMGDLTDDAAADAGAGDMALLTEEDPFVESVPEAVEIPVTIDDPTDVVGLSDKELDTIVTNLDKRGGDIAKSDEMMEAKMNIPVDEVALGGLLNYMDKLLGHLPKNKIEAFAKSKHYLTYQTIIEQLTKMEKK